ncbi:MAG: hypothetical protein WC646_03735 [Candidatus Paceibacterota bacterium]|jgi:hypothetical protein
MDAGNQNSILGDSFLNSQYFNPAYLFERGSFYIQKFFELTFTERNMNLAKSFLFIMAMFFLTVICYVVVRMIEIRRKEHKHLHHEIIEYAKNKAEQEKRLREEVGGSKNPRWSKTLNYIFSQHSSDWKLAIIEADSILENLLKDLGFQGETLGDRLKSANQETFRDLSSAWEVHTIRNRIAHEGLAFELSHHEAKRVIALYEQIFHAYGYI